MKSGVFIERDTLLNLATQRGQQKTPLTFEQLRINDAVVTPLQRLRSGDFGIFVTSNQPEVSRGNLTRREVPDSRSREFPGSMHRTFYAASMP